MSDISRTVTGTMNHSPLTPLDQTLPKYDVGHHHLYEAGGPLDQDMRDCGVIRGTQSCCSAMSHDNCMSLVYTVPILLASRYHSHHLPRGADTIFCHLNVLTPSVTLMGRHCVEPHLNIKM